MSQPSQGDGRRFVGKRRAWAWWFLALAWMGLIYFLSDQSQLALPIELWWSDLLSWLAHFSEYAILACLLWFAARSTPGLSRRAATIAFVVVALYALSDEVHQSFVPGRMPDIRDWLVDLVGAGLALVVLTRRRG